MFQNIFTLSHLYWDPNRVCFYIPYLNHPVVWYGILFALGFLVSYSVIVYIFRYEVFQKLNIEEKHISNTELFLKKCVNYPTLFPKSLTNIPSILTLLNKYIKLKTLPYSFFSSSIFKVVEIADKITERFTTFGIIGVVIGARLGHVLFYSWPYYKNHLIDILKIWEGGLASHGASLGLLIALGVFYFCQRKQSVHFSFLHLIDVLAITTGFMAFFIRLGNFVNQEIVGVVTTMPWGVIFGHPFAGEAVLVRHPVQLYEAFFYLSLGGLCFFLWKKAKVNLGNGQMAGLFITLLFTFRFFIEFYKEQLEATVSNDFGLQMGQILSLPFIALGIALYWRAIKLKEQQYKKSQS